MTRKVNEFSGRFYRLLAVGGLLLLFFLLLSLRFLTAPAEAHPTFVGGNRAALTVTVTARTGITRTMYEGDADGHKFYNDGKTWIEVLNDSGSPITVTFITPYTRSGLAIPDVAVGIPTATTKIIGPFRPDLFNHRYGTDKSMTYLNLTAATDVYVGAWRLPNAQ